MQSQLTLPEQKKERETSRSLPLYIKAVAFSCLCTWIVTFPGEGGDTRKRAHASITKENELNRQLSV